MMRIYSLEELLLPTDHATSDRREWASGNLISQSTLLIMMLHDFTVKQRSD